MSTYYDSAVTVSASLANTAFINPVIGSSGSFTTGFKDGDTAEDAYVSVGATTSPPTYLTPVIGSGSAYALVTNAVNGANVTIYACVSTTYTPIGVLRQGAIMVVPLQVATRLGASVASATQTVGVTFTAVDVDPA